MKAEIQSRRAIRGLPPSCSSGVEPFCSRAGRGRVSREGFAALSPSCRRCFLAMAQLQGLFWEASRAARRCRVKSSMLLFTGFCSAA